MMDKMRMLEGRKKNWHRFTYCCSGGEIRGLKIIAADLGVPVNKVIHDAVLLYIRSNYSQEHWEQLLGKRPQE